MEIIDAAAQITVVSCQMGRETAYKKRVRPWCVKDSKRLGRIPRLYESPSQFGGEYKQLFGKPPRQDIRVEEFKSR